MPLAADCFLETQTPNIASRLAPYEGFLLADRGGRDDLLIFADSVVSPGADDTSGISNCVGGMFEVDSSFDRLLFLESEVLAIMELLPSTAGGTGSNVFESSKGDSIGPITTPMDCAKTKFESLKIKLTF